MCKINKAIERSGLEPLTLQFRFKARKSCHYTRWPSLMTSTIIVESSNNFITKWPIIISHIDYSDKKVIQPYQSAELSAGPHWEKRRLIRTLVLCLWKKSSYHYKVLLHSKNRQGSKFWLVTTNTFNPAPVKELIFLSVSASQTNQQTKNILSSLKAALTTKCCSCTNPD